jgi:2-polyprenyl-3-methyl-5-hydroxy-6-metoxy-1,4-benzoquinol methylase
MFGLARWIRSRLARRSGSDASPEQAWDAQYAAGRWDYLAQLPELARYSVLAGYIGQLGRGGAVLDVGCGQGLLLRSLPAAACSKYVGIDLSASAIGSARAQQHERSAFLVADCEHYSPGEEFDAIVFNEVLYFLKDPLGVIDRYAGSLRAGGIVLVSMCTAARDHAAILRQLKTRYVAVDEVLLSRGAAGLSWVCAAFRAPGRS